MDLCEATNGDHVCDRPVHHHGKHQTLQEPIELFGVKGFSYHEFDEPYSDVATYYIMTKEALK